MSFTSITIQGNIISTETLEKIRSGENYPHQQAVDFGFEKKVVLREKIASAWATVRGQWEVFRTKLENLPENDTGFTITRKFWIIPFLYELGYDIEASTAETVNQKSYAINFRDRNRDDFPVIVTGYYEKLDRKPESGRFRMSPHALMQEYLNCTEHLYGLVTNGKSLRLLRDSNKLSRLAYIEFDLEKIMEDGLYNEFAVLYRLLHSSRMPQSRDKAEESIIEYYHQESIDSGSRIREKLREAVHDAIIILANGFLKNSQNYEFIELVRRNEINPETMYKLLLRCIYRIIFLATIEERNLVYPKLNYKDPEYEKLQRLKNIYLNYYSIEKYRNLVSSPGYINPSKNDLWQGLLATFRLFEPGGEGVKLGIQPLGGELFGLNAMKDENIDLYSLKLTNENFTEFFIKLSAFRDERGVLTRINYRDLDVEELGSVYEALLELQPYFSTEGPYPFFGFTEGSERKLTGSYYTRHDLVAQLIKTALLPVMEERLGRASTREEKEKALLNITVCDPAAGSGHFLIAAAKVMGFELARIRSGEENPGEEWVLQATRDVIENCIYGVDKNPAAVELCRLSLWLVGHNRGKPLTFLKHKIKCGDSLIGVDDLSRLTKGIPKGAFNTSMEYESETALIYKKLNQEFLKTKVYTTQAQEETLSNDEKILADNYEKIIRIPVNKLADYSIKETEYMRLETSSQMNKDRTACNLFTYAFFQQYNEKNEIITSETLALFLSSEHSINKGLKDLVNAKALEYKFFHWPLEFPLVFEKGGFDVVLGNPPWEIMELKEKEFFESRDKSIAQAENKDKRTKLIELLKNNNPGLYRDYLVALQYINASRKFIQESGVFKLTIRGRVNTYSVFSEKAMDLLNSQGRAGILIPTGIATDDSNKFFFSRLVESNRLVSLFDFENRKKLFKDVDSRYKFCLLTLSGGPLPANHEAKFAFFLHDVLDLQDKIRVFTLTRDDFLRINPNTKTCPIFRTKIDADLTKKIYNYVPILLNEEKSQNPWGVTFRQGLFNMATDSHLFKTASELEAMGFTLKGNRFVKGRPPYQGDEGEMWLPLYEAKMIWHYDHRFGTYESVDSRSNTQTPIPSLEQYQNPEYVIKPWYWVEKNKVLEILKPKKSILKNKDDKLFNWHLSFRNNARTTDERTFISSIIPICGVGNSMPLFLFIKNKILASLIILANSASILFDYIVRQKVAGINVNFFYVEQFPFLPFQLYTYKELEFIIASILELNYTSYDIKSFADDIWIEANVDLRRTILKQWLENKSETGGHEWKIPDWADAYPEIHWESPMSKGSWTEEELINYDKGCPLPPFKWDEDRRARLKAELDAWYALLYGLSRDELRYILDPQDVYGEEFPGETFRVLKDKEMRKYGEYRTRRLILEAYDRLAPAFDMEAHLKKMKEVWEKYQENLSEKKEYNIKEEDMPIEKLEENKEIYGQGRLFDIKGESD